MIRINLLPIRAFRRKESIRKQVSIYFLTIIFLAAILGFAYVSRQGTVRELQSQQEALKAQETELAKKVREVEDLKKEEEELQGKLKIIADLEQKRTGPVRILDEISRRTPPNKAWLVDLTKEDNRLSIKGVAMDNETIALFMSNLEESDFLKGVELVRSSQEVRNELRLKSFSINATAALTKEEQAPAAEQAPQPDRAEK